LYQNTLIGINNQIKTPVLGNNQYYR